MNSLFRLIFSLVAAFLISQLNLEYFESLLYDLRIRYRPAPAVSDNVEIILVRPPSINSLNRYPRIEDHRRLLEKLNGSNPRSIVYVQIPDDIQGSSSEFTDFTELAQQTPHFYATKEELLLPGEQAQPVSPQWLEGLPRYSAIPTYDNPLFANDSVTRRALLTYGGQALLPLFLAQLYNPDIHQIDNIRGLFEFLKTDQIYIDYRPANFYPIHEFSDVLAKGFQTDRFKDKIVLIGFDVERHPKNYIRTPYSREVVAMTTTEMYANIIDTLILNTAPVRLPPWALFFFTAVIASITVTVTLTVKPARGLAIIAATMLGYSAFTYILFWPLGIWAPLAHPLLAVFLCYYFFIPYRLIIENRKSWEYYQKNKLLMQVEELKTNFISMMSHDLKTPIARIQGMTEVILQKGSNLSKEQESALTTIKQSSQDLLGFITSILSFGRIESEGVQLHLQTKDINALLRETVNKSKFHASEKGVQIVEEYEPLFSIRMDVELIRQVFTNLIENAIKYSPNNSKVLITSEEADGQVIIQIADQGMGIAEDEIPNIFMKFFRSKNAKTSPVKGSGLGLYLAKYFVDLHKGSIAVESKLGQGSTFTVTLPLDPDQA